jgi:hypothetical protein
MTGGRAMYAAERFAGVRATFAAFSDFQNVTA